MNLNYTLLRVGGQGCFESFHLGVLPISHTRYVICPSMYPSGIFLQFNIFWFNDIA